MAHQRVARPVSLRFRQVLRRHLAADRGINVHPATAGRFIRKLGYRYKKTLRASEQGRDDVAAARAAWQEWQRTCDPARLVFLDETGARTDMIRLRGRAMGATRCLDHAPGGHWNTMTLIAGLRLNELTAPWCLNRAMNGEAFKEYLRTQLAPTLNQGDLVICDNLSAHKVDGVHQIMAASGATILYLPLYSPDLNPIEQVFAKLKTLLRRATARTSECLWRTIGKLLNRCSPQECQNYFNHSGYNRD